MANVHESVHKLQNFAICARSVIRSLEKFRDPGHFDSKIAVLSTILKMNLLNSAETAQKRFGNCVCKNYNIVRPLLATLGTMIFVFAKIII